MWPWALRRKNERRLAQLQSNGLTQVEGRYLAALCRSGKATPPWLVDKLIGAADDTRAAGEEVEP